MKSNIILFISLLFLFSCTEKFVTRKESKIFKEYSNLSPQQQSTDTLKLRKVKRKFLSKWLIEDIYLTYNSYDTVIVEHKIWKAYKRVSPNTLQIWDNRKIKYYNNHKVLYSRKMTEILGMVSQTEFINLVVLFDTSGKIIQKTIIEKPRIFK